MRDRILLALVLGLVVLGALGYQRLETGKAYGLKVGEPAPPVKLPALNGGEVDLASFRGRVVVLNFWATWCPPCVSEMPSLERLHRTLKGDGLVVLSVSVDEDGAVLAKFVSDVGVTFPVLRDPGAQLAAGAYRTTGYPETFVLDGGGIIREVFVGPADWDVPEAVEHFRRLVKAAARPPAAP